MSEYLFLKKLKIKRKKEIEPQEIFLDNLAQKKEEELGIPENKLEVPLSKKIIFGVFLFFIFLTLGTLIRTVQLQVFASEELSMRAEKNKFIMNSIKAERGVIYDAKGKQLVFNKAFFDLVLDKNQLTKDENEKIKILREISQIINEDFNDLNNKIKENNGQILIKKNLEHNSLIILETKINNFSGFKIIKNSTRYYEQGLTFSHLIGYIGMISLEEIKNNPENEYIISDYFGKDGLEKIYEKELRTNPGKVKIERDVYGNIISEEIISLPESGNSLILWIDSDLQNKIKEELEKTLEKIGSKKAVGIALDPKTGGILGMVNIPSFDNNTFNKDADQGELIELLSHGDNPLFNRAISGLYASGSTIKPLIASAALEENIISPNKSLNCEGKISIQHKYDPDITYVYRDWSTHGATDMRKGIAESCNVYFYTIGGGYKGQEGLGPTRIKKYLDLFGWGKKTGIDLPGEKEGIVPSPELKKEIWLDGDTYNLSIGQGGLLITPIQAISSFAAIANGGSLLKPKIVKEIINSQKNTVKKMEAEVIMNNFISQENLKIVREGMRDAVTGRNAPQASAITLNSLPVNAAAKTGTAETSRKDIFHNWVTVFAPYENPEIVLLIMIEDVKGVQAAALPTAKEILQWYFSTNY